MRLFVAVRLSVAARDAIQSALDDFPVVDPPWRWVSSDNWHLTLKFLGDTAPGHLDALKTALDGVSRNHSAFEMSLGAFGGFPNLRAPRVLFYRVDTGRAAIEDLAVDVDAAVERATGLARDRRRFHAHATVARVKDVLPATIVSGLESVPALTRAVTRVDSFELMESRLQRIGALYKVVKEFALA